MPKYTETPAGNVIDARWFKRIANELAEANRLKRKELKLTGMMKDREPTTQEDDAGT